MSSAVAVRHVLRRPPFRPSALIQRHNSGTRRFYSADCTAAAGKKPAAETNKATVEDVLSRKMDGIMLAFYEYDTAWKELAQQVQRERRTKACVRRTVFAAGLAAIYYYVQMHRTNNEDTEISAGNN